MRLPAKRCRSILDFMPRLTLFVPSRSNRSSVFSPSAINLHSFSFIFSASTVLRRHKFWMSLTFAAIYAPSTRLIRRISRNNWANSMSHCWTLLRLVSRRPVLCFTKHGPASTGPTAAMALPLTVWEFTRKRKLAFFRVWAKWENLAVKFCCVTFPQ